VSNIKLEAMKKKIRELLYDTDLKTDEIESLTKELLDLYNVSNSTCEYCNENEAKIKVNICHSCDEHKLQSSDC
tara:strand:- start:30 stop:251 length:222 start_codon:yes stop_codon:yes gene_type:complete